MTLLAPWNLLFLGLLGPLVLLYVLKQKRTERPVGSTLLWEQVLRDLSAEHPWQRLRPQLSLLLQALAIALGAFALSRPVGGPAVPRGATVAVVLDVSPSMAARGGERTALDEARRTVDGIARSLGPGGRMLVVAAGAEPSVLLPPTADVARIHGALSAIGVEGGRPDLIGAIALAEERLRGAVRGSRVVVLTDAADAGELSLPSSGWPVRVERVGEGRDNVAIVAVDARARVDAAHPDRVDLFVRVERRARSAGRVFVVAEVEGLGVRAARALDLARDGATSVVLPLDVPAAPDGGARRIGVHLAGEGGSAHADALSLDDVAFARAPGADRLPVFLVHSPGPEVQRALVADASADVFELPPSRLAELAARERSSGGLFVVADALPPGVALPGDVLAVGPRAAAALAGSLGAPAPARLVDVDDADPRMRFVRLDGLVFPSLRAIRGAEWRPLVSTEAGAAIAVLERPERETVLVAFDPATTRWPSDPSFVVFLHNVVERSRERQVRQHVPDGPLGAPLRVAAEDGAEVRVVAPSGATRTATARGGVAIVPIPSEVGLFSVTTGRRTERVARQLLDPAESDLRPKLRVIEGGSRSASVAEPPAQRTELLPFLALAVLLFVVLDAFHATRKEVR